MPRRSENSIAFNVEAVKKIATTKHVKQKEYTIKGAPGLLLVVKSSGAATWFVQYRIGKGPESKKRRHSIGRHGVKSLDDARNEARDILSSASKGVDKIAERVAEEASLSLRQMFEERLAKDEETARRTLDDYALALEKDVFPTLGEKKAKEISSDQLARLLERVEDRAKHAAHKARSALGSTYRWAQRRRLVDINPCVGLAFTHQSERRKRVLTDDELGRLWRGAAGFEKLSLSSRRIIQLAMLTVQRNSEVAGMERSEPKGLETSTPRWDIPARRMKRKSDDQYVPLSKQAAKLVKAALADTPESPHVFPGTTHGRRVGQDWQSLHISQDTISHAFARLSEAVGIKDLHLHDMRKCATTWLAEHGHAAPEVLDAILHHGRKGVTGTHYNFALYEGQVRKALQAWADHLDSAAVERPATGKIVRMAKA